MEHEENTQFLDFDTAVYSLQAIKNASYDFTDRATILIEIIAPDKARVSLESLQEGSGRGASLMRDFIRHVLDHQIRLDVAEDYKLIREMIVAQAFEPVDNLEQVLSSVKP